MILQCNPIAGKCLSTLNTCLMPLLSQGVISSYNESQCGRCNGINKLLYPNPGPACGSHKVP